MDLRSEILKQHSKPQTMKIAAYIGDNQNRFDELFEMFLNGENRVSQRAAWALRYCTEAQPQLILPHLAALIENLDKPVHDAIKRNTVKALTFVDIPEQLLGRAADICFEYLASPKEAIATRVFAMEVLYEICKKEPDLVPELKLLIEEHYANGSAGFKSKARKVLKGISKISGEI